MSLSKVKKILKKFLYLLLFSLVYVGIGYVIGILISNRFDYALQEVLSYEGLILLIIGILFSMKGNPSGSSISGVGQNNANAMSFYDLEVTRLERESNPYHKDFLKNNIVVFAFSNLSIILGGILIIASTMIFF